MSAYIIADIGEIHDQATYDRYRAQTPGLIQKWRGRFVIRGGKTEAAEGAWQPGRLVVIEFPDMATAKGFYASPEYREILPLRLNASSGGKVIFAEGV
ncbi:MAG: DUF1330 domain-containing protein [Rhodospirillales bacterium]